ncbi:MAG: choice-of-anchor J domain-containing protein [Bacteroidales bacterium]|nr:choice-of-anchor J domain-containing protein [Bacteroidales bacterium]
MNKRKILSALFFLSAIAFSFTACVKGEFDEPPINIPKVNFKANSTIAELLISHPGTLDSINDTIIISGIVTANDESGNLYKKIVIQDETAGIEIDVDQTSLYADYRIGQRVFVKCFGMYIGKYNELPQLGYIYQNKIGRLPATLMKNHLFLDSLPGNAPVPLVVDATDLDISMVNKLVRLENVAFTDAGDTWAPTDGYGEHGLEGGPDADVFIVRTSNFANFASLSVPSGSGTIQGILSVFGSTYQLTIRDTNDIIGFKNTQTFFSETFGASLGGFTTISLVGTQAWKYDASYGATMSGFATGASHQNEDWLISPAINLTAAPTAMLKFSHAINKGNVANVSTNHTVWISKNYSTGEPSTATWEQLTVPTYPAGNSWTFINSGDVIIPSAYLGQANVRIAFKYLCSDTESATWEVKNIKVTE